MRISIPSEEQTHAYFDLEAASRRAFRTATRQRITGRVSRVKTEREGGTRTHGSGQAGDGRSQRQSRGWPDESGVVVRKLRALAGLHKRRRAGGRLQRQTGRRAGGAGRGGDRRRGTPTRGSQTAASGRRAGGRGG